MTRTSGLIFALVGISLGLSWFMARRGDQGPEGGADCLSHANCRADERCVLVPRGDGFASFGTCGGACSEDVDCPNGWRCFSWVDQKGALSPAPRDGAGLTRVKACAHHAVLEKKE